MLTNVVIRIITSKQKISKKKFFNSKINFEKNFNIFEIFFKILFFKQYKHNCFRLTTIVNVLSLFSTAKCVINMYVYSIVLVSMTSVKCICLVVGFNLDFKELKMLLLSLSFCTYQKEKNSCNFCIAEIT